MIILDRENFLCRCKQNTSVAAYLSFHIIYVFVMIHHVVICVHIGMPHVEYSLEILLYNNM